MIAGRESEGTAGAQAANVIERLVKSVDCTTN